MESDGLEALILQIAADPLESHDDSESTTTPAQHQEDELPESTQNPPTMPNNRSSLEFLPSQEQLRDLAISGARQFGARSTTKECDRLHEECKEFALLRSFFTLSLPQGTEKSAVKSVKCGVKAEMIGFCARRLHKRSSNIPLEECWQSMATIETEDFLADK